MRLFKDLSRSIQATLLARFLPDGRAWEAKLINGTNLKKLLYGLAGELQKVHEKLNEITEQHDVNTTTKLLRQWETSIGIPDGCFLTAGKTDSERLTQVLVKFGGMHVQTTQDLIDLAVIFGITVTVESGVDAITFPMTFPIPMYTDASEARFYVVVRYDIGGSGGLPYTFPFIFEPEFRNIFECIVRKTIQANCIAVFIKGMPITT